MTRDENPLFLSVDRPAFDRIEAHHVEPGIRLALEQTQAAVDRVVSSEDPPTWSNTIEALETATDRLSRIVTPVAHLVAVAQTPELRAAYNAVLPEMSAFWSSLTLNPDLWARLQAYACTEEAEALTGLRRRHLDRTMRDFRRAGAALPDAERARLQEMQVELAGLAQKFSENVLDETAAFELLVTDEDRLAGVPEAARARFRARAEEAGKDGWLLTLDQPSVQPVLKYAEDRALRQELYLAYARRCREGDYDNRALIARILRLRDEMAEVLGYDTFSDFQLEERMARDGARARAFEDDLTERTRPFWKRDLSLLEEQAQEVDLDRLQPWDVAFLGERARKLRYDLDDEQLRPYFPLDRVQQGLFDIAEQVFGFRVVERPRADVWHEDVQTWDLLDEDGTVVAAFYTDWFPRKEKRPGAWMGSFITGGPTGEGFLPHLCVICGNFTPPQDGLPALVTHDEVRTLFHEFGHLLHHSTSRVEIPSRAGTNVAWDWVELPRQLLENWTWERDALDVFAHHHETGEPLPDDLFRRMLRARRFLGGWRQMRQLSFGVVDLELHSEIAPRLREEAQAATESGALSDQRAEGELTSELDQAQGEEIMDRVRELFSDFAPDPSFADLHNLTSFSHLFAGGYAAGYYSYLWSEVLDADVFTRFAEEGVLNGETGRAFVRSILSRGDSEDPEALFREFMGRDPDPEALLVRNLGEMEAVQASR